MLCTRMILSAVLLTCLMLFFLGCGVEVSVETDTSKQGNTPTPSNVQGGVIETVILEDGTRCVVWDGYHAGGISCDWRPVQP